MSRFKRGLFCGSLSNEKIKFYVHVGGQWNFYVEWGTTFEWMLAGSGVVLDYIDSWSMPPFLLCCECIVMNFCLMN